MEKAVDARISYYLRKVNEDLQSRYTTDAPRRARRYQRLMKYKSAMHERIRADGWEGS